MEHPSRSKDDIPGMTPKQEERTRSKIKMIKAELAADKNL
jgi:hypothetical protein